MDDLDVAVTAARAAAEAALAARAAAPLRPRAKGVSADLVTDADAAAEAAAAAVLRARRPGDAITGEEGTDEAGEGRRWWVDGIDGTVGFASSLPASWCSAVVLEDGDGPLVAAIVHPEGGELHAGARGHGATIAPLASADSSPAAVGASPGGAAALVATAPRRAALHAPPRPLAAANVAVFLRQDRLVLPGVRAVAHALLDAAGLIRHAGPGSLELAWVAAGRLDAWVQPATDPWDWLPGALLVREAGGVARVVQARTRWHLAGPAPLVDELERLIVAAG